MRDTNARLVLSLVRRHGSLSKTDIARITGLSAQTVSVIMRSLEEDGLLLRQPPVRGRVGQPSVPISLNPAGAYFFGLKIGRRSADLVLIDFLGAPVAMQTLAYRHPAAGDVVEFVDAATTALKARLDPAQRGRIAGLGIAMPFELWNWVDLVGAPREVVDLWRHHDIRADIQARLDLPVYLENDATAACGAEMVFGKTAHLRDFVYFYIGAFAGGGVVLNGRLFSGASGNAGALGSMPVPGPDGPVQLIHVASITTLEKSLVARGQDASHLWTSPDDWGDLGADLDAWVEAAGVALAYATVAATTVVDFEAAVIEGWMPVPVRARLVDVVRRTITERIDLQGIRAPEILEGTVGLHARALGGASLPLSDRFLIGQAWKGS